MTTSPTHELAPGPAMQVFPTSFAQQRLWFLDQLNPQSTAYNAPVAIRLNFAVDVKALEQSLNALIKRHEVLHTTFVAIDGRLMQVIAPSLSLPLPVVNLSGLPEDERKDEASRLVNEEVQRSFNLVQGPLIRVSLLNLAAEEYILLLTIHHMISDGWSMRLFYGELVALYEAFTTGQPPALPDLPIQYVDFAIWQQERAQKGLLADQLAYWKRQLAGAPATLNLPTDRPHPAWPTMQGSKYSVTLPPHLAEALKALSQQEDVTLFMTLIAAFQTLLHLYSGQDDIVLGTLTAGRTQAEIEALIGFFINPLVLRTDLSGNPSFRDFLKMVREVAISAIAHEDVPFDYLVRELRPERTLGQNPLFQVHLTLDPAVPDSPSSWIPGPIDAANGTSRFDLSLTIAEHSWGLDCCFEYSTDLFDEATIVRMAGHWQRLIESIVANPDQHLAALPLLTEVERRQLLVDWNATATDYPKDRCLHQLFEDQVERTPDDIAVVYEDVRLTYQELNARANQLSHHLRQLGVGPEVLVGLCVERSLEVMVGLLGILKAGGAYVPLDPTYPAERVAFMLEDAQVAVLVTQQHLCTRLQANEIVVVCLDTDTPLLAQQPDANPSPLSTADNLAYVIYTSGSTGRPKGVQILQRAVVNFLTSMIQQPGLVAQDTLLAVTTLSFDIAALELFLPLLVGARLVIASQDVVADGTALAELLVRSGANVMQATPITWRLLLATGWQGSPHLKILCGGEALPLELARQLLARAASLWNMYGPTETTIWSSVNQLKLEDAVVTVGRPIANTQMYILNKQLQLVPIGVPGELYIGGDGLARGYLRRPELTTDRFIQHPFSDEPGARLYRTGDLARYLVDGTIEVLGRMDHQVKLRGYRIELGEIESVLEQHVAVRQAVVVAREDLPGDKRLVAYVVLHEGRTATVAELQQQAQKHLPHYMVPAALVLLETLPLTPNGKVDRRALPAPDSIVHASEDTYVAPTKIVHYQLIQIWEELLNVHSIGIRDNFFYLGGHSLLAARLIERIEQVCGKKIPLATLFAGPTIEQLADALQQQEDIGARTPIVAIRASGTRRPIFFLHGDWTGGPFYCFALGRALEPDQPFYTLEPYRLDEQEIPPTLEAMAAAHLRSLRAVQPEGPYLLGGFCNGGLLAYEMARQLRAEGQQVDLLFLINPTPPAGYRFLYNLVDRFSRVIQLRRDQQAVCFLRLRHALRHIYRYLHSANDSRLADFDKLLAVDPRLDSMFPPAEALRKDYIGVITWLNSDYLPDLYPGKVTFFLAREEAFLKGLWRTVAKASVVEGHVIPGTHISCVTEYTDDLAELLRTCRDRAQAEVSSH